MIDVEVYDIEEDKTYLFVVDLHGEDVCVEEVWWIDSPLEALGENILILDDFDLRSKFNDEVEEEAKQIQWEIDRRYYEQEARVEAGFID